MEKDTKNLKVVCLSIMSDMGPQLGQQKTGTLHPFKRCYRAMCGGTYL
jgi:hypothetical protein